jgi:hypothetical protein
MSMKHKLYTKNRIAEHIKHKVERNEHPQYPVNCLLILDDFLSSDLLRQRKIL